MNHLPDWLWAWILRVEGDTYVENPQIGERSKYGITEKSYPNVDVATLSDREARRIYDYDFWVPMHCRELPLPVAFALMDTAINLGHPRAVGQLQKVLGVEIDGIVGPKTIKAAAREEALGRTPVVVSRFQTERIRYYTDLVARKPVYLQYLSTWLDRTTLLLYHCATAGSEA